jgi:hypothetical protein
LTEEEAEKKPAGQAREEPEPLPKPKYVSIASSGQTAGNINVKTIIVSQSSFQIRKIEGK